MQQIEACHNIVGIPQVSTFLRTYLLASFLIRNLWNIYVNLIAGMDSWYDWSDKSSQKSSSVEKKASFLCHSTSFGERHPFWWYIFFLISSTIFFYGDLFLCIIYHALLHLIDLCSFLFYILFYYKGFVALFIGMI